MPKKVTVGEQVLTLIENGEDRWEVFGDGKDPIGEVWKSTYTYSPRAAGFGGRIARFHKQVPCWRTSKWDRAQNFETRKAALTDLLRELHR